MVWIADKLEQLTDTLYVVLFLWSIFVVFIFLGALVSFIVSEIKRRRQHDRREG